MVFYPTKQHYTGHAKGVNSKRPYFSGIKAVDWGKTTGVAVEFIPRQRNSFSI
jgi:hypothetical protein